MGLDRFQENMREWLERAWKDRDYILGKSRYSEECHKAKEWPVRRKDQIRISLQRTYDLYSPCVTSEAGEKRSLEEGSSAKILDGCQAFHYSNRRRLPPYRYDAEFLFCRNRRGDAKAPYVGRLYLNFDHTDLSSSLKILDLLRWSMARYSSLFSLFKLAGPCKHRDRRDSAVIFLTEEGCLQHGFLVDMLSRTTTRDSDVPYGTLAVETGIGFAFNPDILLTPLDWRSEYINENSSFGTLIACYVLHGLITASGGFEPFCNRVATLLVEDGFDPMALHRLSSDARNAGAGRVLARNPNL